LRCVFRERTVGSQCGLRRAAPCTDRYGATHGRACDTDPNVEMTGVTGMARPRTKKTETKTLEQRLWEAADALRGNQEPSEYKHVVLGLVFLKYISDRFEERRAAVEAALADPDSEDYIPNEQ